MRQPGHRFFFSPEEVEPVKAVVPRRILIAGIGNIFLGDDAFGVEVAQRLLARTLPASVRVRDFGIRGYDLAYALLDGYDLTILVDACPRGEPPGTVYVIEPQLEDAEGTPAPVALDAHTMNPVNVIRLAKSMGTISKRILLVGCEPAELGGEEGEVGLSEPVLKAVDEAVKVVEKLVESALQDEKGVS
ncbi:MAG: hydrogenase maturation protease [Acidobacteriaceae bacterium]|nr:hydrogenase maturation protease [Acidobacteriaceae bacterium]